MNTHILKSMQIIFILVISVTFFFSLSCSTQAQQDATGADDIFDLIGVEKPTQWQVWSGTERQSYLQSLGAYPLQGRKYRGQIDLDRYFQTLGVTQPQDWENLTPDERVVYIDQLSGPQATKLDDAEPSSGQNDQKQSDIQPTTTQAASKEAQPSKSIWTTPWLIIFFVLIGAGVIFFAIKAMLGKDW